MISKNQVRFIRSLHQKKFREEHGLFIAEGAKVVNELLESPFKITGIYGLASWEEQFLALNPEPSIQPQYISEQEMARISTLSTPGPVLAVVQVPERETGKIPIHDGLTLVLDDIQDPGNLGTIIRVADWFGIRRVICSEACVELYNPKVVQSTMGSITRVPVYYNDLGMFFTQYASGVPVFGTFLGGEDLYTHPLAANAIIVIGNEARGISSAVEQHITNRITIPPGIRSDHPFSRAESLNAAMAAAVVCSEFNRRRYE